MFKGQLRGGFADGPSINISIGVGTGSLLLHFFMYQSFFNIYAI